jgi:hypothetical protein
MGVLLLSSGEEERFRGQERRGTQNCLGRRSRSAANSGRRAFSNQAGTRDAGGRHNGKHPTGIEGSQTSCWRAVRACDASRQATGRGRASCSTQVEPPRVNKLTTPDGGYWLVNPGGPADTVPARMKAAWTCGMSKLEDYERRCSRWRTRDLVWSYDVCMDGLAAHVNWGSRWSARRWMSFIGRSTGDARKQDCPTAPVE